MKRFFLIMLMLACHSLYAQVVIPIEITPEGHILVKATINGIEGNFIFDTGGGLHVVTKKFAGKLSKFPKQDDGFTIDGIISINWIGKQLTIDLRKSEMLVVF